MKSKLDKIKNSGYKIPKGYFDGLEDQVLVKMQSEKTLNKISSAGFSLPDDYFDTFETSVLNKLAKPETKVVNLFSRRSLIYISSVAAALILAFTLFINNETGSEEFNYELVSDYIIDEGIDSYDLAALLTEEELSTMDLEIYSNSYQTDSVEDYLLENMDFEEIIDQ